MNVVTIAYNNFKNNLKVYSMFFISMVFSVSILSNFLILMDGEALDFLNSVNSNYAKMMLQILTTILSIFLFFFIWYTSNIFLRNRKKEIGIYTFMGLDSIVVGKIYFIEMFFIGLSSCIVGLGVGSILSKFFQMIVLKIAGFSVDIAFNVTLNSIIYTFAIFMGIFILMSIKGFVNIVRSSIIDLLNAGKKEDKIPKINFLTYITAITSVILIIYGYYIVLKDSNNAIITLLLVCVGTYGLFGSVMPIVFKFLINKKSILYKGENIITINNLSYRLKKNFVTYATIGILTASTVTVLGTSAAVKKSYTESYANDTLYSVSFYSKEDINTEKIKNIFTSVGKEKFEIKTKAIIGKSTLKEVDQYKNSDYIVLSYEQVANILRANGNEESLKKISEEMVSGDKAVYVERPGTLASLIMESEITVNDIPFKISEDKVRMHILGSTLNYPTIIVNNENYEKIKKSSTEINFYGLKINNEENLLDDDIKTKISDELNTFINPENTKGKIGIDYASSIDWMKIVYAIGTFLFLVFILAEASIIYIKIYSDAREDKYKYKILLNIGASKEELRKSINKEVALFYMIPAGIGLIHSYFAINALGKFLSLDLNITFIVSIFVFLIIFSMSGFLSAYGFKKVVEV